MPADTNPYGGVFGGWLMGQMGLACGSLRVAAYAAARRWWSRRSDLKFPGAMAVGDELSVYVELMKQGRTSLTLAAEAVARERDGDAGNEVAEGEFTFVALDEDGQAAGDRAMPSPSPLAGEGEAPRSDGRERGRSASCCANAPRRMRSDPTDAEHRLWQMLRAQRLAGFKFRRQRADRPLHRRFRLPRAPADHRS